VIFNRVSNRSVVTDWALLADAPDKVTIVLLGW